MKEISEKVLNQEDIFILKNNLDKLKIVSYLESNNLIKVSSEAKGEKRTLFEYYLDKKGKISIYYNRIEDISELIIRKDTPRYIVGFLKDIIK